MRVGGRRLHDVEEIPILIDQRLTVRIKVRRRNSEFIGSSDFGRKRIGEILYALIMLIRAIAQSEIPARPDRPAHRDPQSRAVAD